MRRSDTVIARIIPCSTPTKTTTAVVVSANANSPGLSRRIALNARRSMRLRAMVKTTAPRTQRGRNWSGPVRKRRTSATTAAVVRCAIWFVPPERSTMAVCVGLPFTTNVPVKAAEILAEARPTMSVSSSRY
jgi:hypothetical protein